MITTNGEHGDALYAGDSTTPEVSKLVDSDFNQTGMSRTDEPTGPLEARLLELVRSELDCSWGGMTDHFLDLGGHSLHAMRLKAALYDEYRIRLCPLDFFRASSLRRLARIVEETVVEMVDGLSESARYAVLDMARTRKITPEEATPMITRFPDKSPAMLRTALLILKGALTGKPMTIPSAGDTSNNLSPLQKHLWSGKASNISLCFSIKGRLDVESLETAINGALERHPIWNMVFDEREGVLKQTLVTRDFALPVIDFENFDDEHWNAVFRSWRHRYFTRPFDPFKGPLFRIWLSKRDRKEHFFCFTASNLITDEWSMGRFVGEITTSYSNRLRGLGFPGVPDIRFTDLAAWQQTWYRGPVIEKQRRFWNLQLSGPTLEKVSNPRATGDMQTHLSRFSARHRALIRRTAVLEGVTPFMVVLAIYKTWLYKLFKQPEQMVGVRFENRIHPKTHQMMGPLSENLPIKIPVNGAMNTQDLIHQVARSCRDALNNDPVPYQLLDDDRIRNMTRIGISYLTLPETAMEGAECGPLRFSRTGCPWDLHLVLYEEDGILTGCFVYQPDSFDSRKPGDFCAHFPGILEQSLQQPWKTIDELVDYTS